MVIQSPSDLRVLLADRRSSWRLRRDPVLLSIDTMDKSESEFWEARLHTYQQECGCRLGAISSLVCAMLILTYIVLQATLLPLPAILLIGIAGAIASLLTGFVGKIIGLSLARARFRRTCAQLLQRISQL
jgi:hypothetical protein